MLGNEKVFTSLLLVSLLPDLPRTAYQQGATRSSTLTSARARLFVQL
jgi:hypothetical protein